jgi:hypothetical protein
MIDDDALRHAERCLSLCIVETHLVPVVPLIAHHESRNCVESPSADVPPTVLSTLQATLIPDDIAHLSLNPFSSPGKQTVALLHALLDITEHVAHSVTLHSATLINDSKTDSLLRQQSAGQHTLHLVNDVLYPSVIRCASSSLSPGFF